MTPSGGALTPALRKLGFHPYTFEYTYRLGNAMSHTREWRAVLLGEKPFDPVILAGAPVAAGAGARRGNPASAPLTTSVTPCAENGVGVKEGEEEAATATRDYDAIVGPPATLAYEAILRSCPRATRVVLVEEPDKLAWEREYEQLLTPILRQVATRGRLVSLMADLHRMMEAMTDVRRSISAVRRPNTSGSATAGAAATRTGALQASSMRLGAALDLFEAQVKVVVPRDRLLVYRVDEGWGPLCDFLGLPVPREGGSAGGAPLPFPVHEPGAEVFASLRERLGGADRVAAVAFLAVAALMFVLLIAFSTPLSKIMEQYRERFNAKFIPYVMEHRDDGSASLREAMKISKKVTMDFKQEVEKEGGVVTSLREALDALANPYDPPMSQTKAPSG